VESNREFIIFWTGMDPKSRFCLKTDQDSESEFNFGSCGLCSYSTGVKQEWSLIFLPKQDQDSYVNGVGLESKIRTPIISDPTRIETFRSLNSRCG